MKRWKLQPEAIKQFFRTRSGGWQPGEQIATDGVRVSLQFIRPKAIDAEQGALSMQQHKKAKRKRGAAGGESIDLLNTRVGIFDLGQVEPLYGRLDSLAWEAFDPGHATLYHGHKGTKMSRGQWKELTYATTFTKKANQRNLRIKDVNEALTTASLCTADINSFETAVQLRLSHWDMLWQHPCLVAQAGVLR